MMGLDNTGRLIGTVKPQCGVVQPGPRDIDNTQENPISLVEFQVPTQSPRVRYTGPAAIIAFPYYGRTLPRAFVGPFFPNRQQRFVCLGWSCRVLRNPQPINRGVIAICQKNPYR